MANPEHLKILKQGVEVWNEWRIKHPKIKPDLEGVDLRGKDLTGVNLSGAMMYGSFLKDIILKDANLTEASLLHSVITFSDLSNAKMMKAWLGAANLYEANLTGADLTDAIIDGASLVRTTVENTTFTGCVIYGISAWDLNGVPRDQSNLVISYAPLLTVDNLEVAQFIYLLLKNEKIRDVIDTITSKVVLILGRFTKPRKAVLEAIRNELRQHDYIPVLFDFDKPASRDIHETVGTLARMARFVIADITNPRCIPQELVSIVEQLPSLPVQPLLKYGSKPWGMYDHIKRYPWVLKIHEYRNLKALQGSLKERVIAPAEEKWLDLNQKD